jgi:phosphate uptake regulator
MNIPRKIQLTGRNTYIISLPHEWVARRGVSKGDALFLNENGDGTLTLSLEQEKKELKTCAIEVSRDEPDSAMRNIVSAYVGGAGTIVLRGKGKSTIAEEARRVLSGVEITDESGDTLTLRVLKFDDIDIDGIIKRAFNVTNSMFELSISAYEEGADSYTEISRKEDDVDRLYLLLLRTMCIEGFSGKDVVFKAIAAKSIEKVGDHLLDICADARATGRNETVAALIRLSKEVYASAYQALSENELDRGRYAKAKREYLGFYKNAESMLKKEKSTSRMLTMRALLEKSNKILRYSEDMIESSTDMYFARMENPPGESD